jgi:hypothetical protein
VVESHASHPLATFKTQHEAIEWAKKNGHRPHVARVRHLNDRQNRITGAPPDLGIGQLTGGIGHDFNNPLAGINGRNPLAGINGSLELLERRLGKGASAASSAKSSAPRVRLAVPPPYSSKHSAFLDIP